MARAAAPIFSGLRARTRTTRRRSNSMGTGTGTRTILKQMTRAVTANRTDNPAGSPYGQSSGRSTNRDGSEFAIFGTAWRPESLGSRGALDRRAQYRAMTLAFVF